MEQVYIDVRNSSLPLCVALSEGLAVQDSHITFATNNAHIVVQTITQLRRVTLIVVDGKGKKQRHDCGTELKYLMKYIIRNVRIILKHNRISPVSCFPGALWTTYTCVQDISHTDSHYTHMCTHIVVASAACPTNDILSLPICSDKNARINGQREKFQPYTRHPNTIQLKPPSSVVARRKCVDHYTANWTQTLN